MGNTAIILIVVTNIFLVLILGVLVFLVYRLYQQKNPNVSSPTSSDPLATTSYHPAALARIKELEKIRAKKIIYNCPNHPEEPGESSCAVCDKLFCPACIKPFKNLHFCNHHLGLIMSKEWDEVLTLKTSTTDPEQGVFLYEAKKKLLDEEDIPTYIETHYKINVDQDFIETYLVLFGIREQTGLLKEKLQTFII